MQRLIKPVCFALGFYEALLGLLNPVDKEVQCFVLRIQLMSPRHKHDRRSRYRLVVHFNRLKPWHLQVNHQPVTLQQSTEIAPQPGHSTEVTPQSEHPEDE